MAHGHRQSLWPAAFAGRQCLVPCRAPFPDPAHRTGRADFPHPALAEGLTPSPTGIRITSPRAATGASARSCGRGARTHGACGGWRVRPIHRPWPLIGPAACPHVSGESATADG